MKQKQTAIVRSQREIAPAIYDMWIETELAAEAVPGQFICVYPKDRSTLLPRPISVCETAEDGRALRIVYRIAGQGTAEFSKYNEGESIAILGMLGNGFPVEAAANRTAEGDGSAETPRMFLMGGDSAASPKIFLMGGGIGIPPMLQLAKTLAGAVDVQDVSGKDGTAAGSRIAIRKEDLQIIVGYRDSQTFLKEDLERYGTVYIATEDGSVGTKGNVMDAIRENGLSADVIYACGPMPMLRAIKQYAGEAGVPAYISLEERMACGVGACLGCVAKTKEIDGHSHVHNARICTDGPVFEAEEVDI